MMVDKQVAIKQDMLLEFRMEIAASRARVLTAKEEGSVYTAPQLLFQDHYDSEQSDWFWKSSAFF